MLWETYSKATVVLYIHKYNYIYLFINITIYIYYICMYLYLNPSNAEASGSGVSVCCPRLCACPQRSWQGRVQGALQPPPSLGCSSGPAGRSAGRCALPGVCSALGAGGLQGKRFREGLEGALQCVPLPSTRASVSLGGRWGGKHRDRSVLCSGCSRCWWGPFRPGGSGILPCPPILRPLESRRGCGAGQ